MKKDVKILGNITSRNNNLNFIRLLSAFMVIVSHSFPICYGENSGDFIYNLTNGKLDIGGIAVGVFFVSGGYLIAGSAERKKTAGKFFSARVKRIFPSLIVLILLWVFILGPLLSTLSLRKYFSNVNTYKYLLNMLLIPVHSLPGVFENNIYKNVVNGALWTLPVEFFCYVLCFLAYKLNLFRQKPYITAAFWGGLVAIFAFYVFRNNLFVIRIIRPLVLYYIGIGFYIFRDKIKIHRGFGVFAILGFVLLILMNCPMVGMLLFFPYMIYFLAFGVSGKLSGFGMKHEISYGVYLWGWPIQQIVSSFGGCFSVWFINVAVTLIIVIILAVINNIFVEQCNWINKKR